MFPRHQIQLQEIGPVFRQHGYIPDDTVCMAVYLSLSLNKPLLIEGPAGVGKTEITKVMAAILDTELIRLQCYEGLDYTHAIYEWNYQRQLLQLKIIENANTSAQEKEKTIFSESFLMKRPLLEAITREKSPVLLIDEVDRADDEFESFFLEILSDWQITIPEIGTIKAVQKPFVILTGNRSRDLSDALRRRCFYLYIDYPDLEKELEIVRHKVPGIDATLSRQICRFLQEVRKLKLDKTPGISETIDWAYALAALHIDFLEPAIIQQTLGIIIKDRKDSQEIQLSLNRLLEETGIIR